LKADGKYQIKIDPRLNSVNNAVNDVNVDDDFKISTPYIKGGLGLYANIVAFARKKYDGRNKNFGRGLSSGELWRSVDSYIETIGVKALQAKAWCHTSKDNCERCYSKGEDGGYCNDHGTLPRGWEFGYDENGDKLSTFDLKGETNCKSNMSEVCLVGDLQSLPAHLKRELETVHGKGKTNQHRCFCSKEFSDCTNWRKKYVNFDVKSTLEQGE